jgi:hypothetical protein
MILRAALERAAFVFVGTHLEVSRWRGILSKFCQKRPISVKNYGKLKL